MMTTAPRERMRAPLEGGEAALVARLRNRDEDAFAFLVDSYGASMVRAAGSIVSSRAVAEEVVQETWLRVLRGLERFEGRSSLKTWIFAILGNCALRRARSEGRSRPFSSLGSHGEDDDPLEDAFFPADHPRWPGAWATVVDSWSSVPEERLLSSEVRAVVRKAIEALPDAQRHVLVLRDVEGWTGEEAAGFLGLTEVNARVLLHRGRARVRLRVARYLEEDEHAG